MSRTYSKNNTLLCTPVIVTMLAISTKHPAVKFRVQDSTRSICRTGNLKPTKDEIHRQKFISEWKKYGQVRLILHFRRKV